MGDSRNEKGYEMAPQNDPEKGGADGEIEQGEWTGLGKEELLRVADTPTWNWARNILLILFWIGWVAMLIAAIIIVVKVPRCPEVEWWEKSVFYQAYPRSLKDSDGDGVGDLKGVEQQLDHLDSLGAKVLYLNSIFKERNATGGSVDIGYDITDFRDVDMNLGSLEDFDALMESANGKEMKVVLEFVPNHSSDDHPWFVASRTSQDSEYADYYVWADGVGADPPNDWKNKYGEPAWTLEEGRQQWYYAYFGPNLPDFNYNNDTLRQEILDILTFWLMDPHLVDGFVFSHVDYLFEPPITTVADNGRRRRQAATTAPVTTAPEPNTDPAAEPEPTSKPMPPQYDFVGDNAETGMKLFELLQEWRKLFNDKSYLGKYRLMVAQSEGPLNQVAKLYGTNKTRLADYPLNTGFLDTFDDPLSGTKLGSYVARWMEAKENANNEKRWNTWMLGCHDRSRIATRAGSEYVNALNVMLMTLPGTPFIYYGEEIGMTDVVVSAEQTQDRVPVFYPGEESRDPYRTPMPWTNATTNAGFAVENVTAYLPLPSDAGENNVQAQKMEDFSNYNIVSELAELHKEPSLVAGEFIQLVADDNVFAYLRAFGDWPRYLVVVNVGSDASHDFYDLGSEYKLPMEGKIVLSTSGKERSGELKKDGKRKGTKESLSGLKTKKGEALLIKLKN